VTSLDQQPQAISDLPQFEIFVEIPIDVQQQRHHHRLVDVTPCIGTSPSPPPLIFVSDVPSTVRHQLQYEAITPLLFRRQNWDEFVEDFDRRMRSTNSSPTLSNSQRDHRLARIEWEEIKRALLTTHPDKKQQPSTRTEDDNNADVRETIDKLRSYRARYGKAQI